ncbi:MAG TPA: hypothetical protein PLD63_08425 [Ignavibacteria bacterium]|nr:hypothetical protein [Ignavibacteria bacterium]
MVLNLEFTQKIITPDVPAFYYPRERLINKLISFKNKKVILITAPAGYGKTSLSVEFFNKLKNEEKIWISISSYDNSIENFFLLLAMAFESNLKKSKFGARLKSVLSRSQNSLFDEKVNDVISSFSSDLFSYLVKKKKDIYIFFDDFHNIDESDEVCTALNYFLEFLPQNVHIIFISRREPTKINYPKFLAKNWLGKITKGDLSFSEQDIKKFIRLNKLKTSKIDKNLLDEYIKSTEGWVTAIQLLLIRSEFNAIKNEDLVYGKSDVFEYFTYELFSHLSPAEKNLLMTLTYPEYFNKHLIENVLEIKNGYKMLLDLYEKNIFINREDENFRFHELLRSYLRKKTEETFTREEITDLYIKLGSHYLKDKEWREDYIGLNYLILAGDYSKLKYWIKMNASEKLLLIHSSGLYKKFDEISNEKFRNSLEFILLKVNTFVYKDKDIENALDYLKQIIQLKFSIKSKDSILIPMNKIKRSELDYYVEILMLICNCMFLKEGISKDNISISEHILNFKLKPEQEIQFTVSLIKSYIATGENSKSKKYILKLKKLFEKIVKIRNSNEKSIDENTFIESIFSMIIFFDYGDFKKGNEIVNFISNNIDIDRFDHSNLSQLCFALFTSYNNKKFDQFFHQLKIKNTEKNKTIFSAYKNQYEFQNILNKFLNHQYKNVINDLEIMKQQTHLKNYIYFIDALILYSYNLIENPGYVLRNTEKGDYSISVTRALILRQEAYLLNNDFDKYLKIKKETTSIGTSNFTLFNQAIILFFECYYFALKDLPKAFKAKFNKFISLAEEYGYENYIKFRAGSNKLSYVFSYALENGIRSEFLKELLSEDIKNLLPEKKKEYNIKVKFFDNCKIFINGVEIKDSIWLRPRSKSIFLYFAYKSKSNQVITKDSIIDDLLFSSKKVNYEAIADVEINKVRKALQMFFRDEFSDNSGKEFITLKNKVYYFVTQKIEINYEFDTDELIKLSSGKINIDTVRILDIYKNDFAEGIYQNWAEDLRDNFKFNFLKTIHNVIKYFEKSESIDDLKLLLEKLSESKISDEEMLSKLLSIYIEEKNDREYIHVYNAYIKRLDKDLSMTPSSELQKHYLGIKNKN